MAETNVIAQVLETILSIPGMVETVRIDLRITRKNALLLSNVIDRGLAPNADEIDGGILANVGKEALEELRAVAREFLEKAGLIDLSEKLKVLRSTK
ncbi:hypothetical protein [Fluviicola sp.]|uniref:hypothetical protein n=1 Tax=Fluviicola sp. TaxID=1917219 RepID=UPI0031E0FFC9